VYQRVRRVLVRRFPYAVFFVEEGDEMIEVLAVLHQASAPARWKSR
jgi:plasmid stabilization system protein ParE